MIQTLPTQEHSQLHTSCHKIEGECKSKSDLIMVGKDTFRGVDIKGVRGLSLSDRIIVPNLERIQSRFKKVIVANDKSVSGCARIYTEMHNRDW